MPKVPGDAALYDLSPLRTVEVEIVMFDEAELICGPPEASSKPHSPPQQNTGVTSKPLLFTERALRP